MDREWHRAGFFIWPPLATAMRVQTGTGILSNETFALASTLILAGFGQASAEGWLAVVNKSRPLCQAAEDFVQIERMAFEYDLRPSPDLEKRAIEFAKRKCASVLEAGPHHVRVERTETFPVDETRSVLLACVKVGDTPCRWTTASILVRYEPVTTEYAEQLSREAIYTCRRLIDNAASTICRANARRRR